MLSKYFAITALGFEAITADELKAIGASDILPAVGGVSFSGDKEILYKANLWLRTATRVLKPIKDFAATTQEMLYDQVRRIHWEEYLNTDKTFAINCTLAGKTSGIPSWIRHSHYASLKIKDGIVDRLRQKQGERPNVDPTHPDVQFNAYFSEGRCFLSLDSTGESLHVRGYRSEDSGKAPLKETLAAAVVGITKWDAKVPQVPLIDPMCGSGTLAIEAAMKALNMAPGLKRKRFGFMGWLDFDRALWDKLVQEAQENVLKTLPVPIFAFDRNIKMVAIARQNAKRAGVDKFVHFDARPIEELVPAEGFEGGVVLVNPPYGERMGEIEELKSLYKSMGDLFKHKMKGYEAYIFTGNLELAKHVGLRTSARHILYNGPIECRVLKYQLY